MEEDLDIQKITEKLLAKLQAEANEHKKLSDQMLWAKEGVQALYEAIRREAERIERGGVSGTPQGSQPESVPNGHVPGGTAVGAGSDTGQTSLNPASATENNRGTRGSAVPTVTPAREAARRNQG